MHNHRVDIDTAGAPHEQQHKFGAHSDGRPGWYILRCGGGTEFRARDALFDLGCDAFVPIEIKWRARWLRKPKAHEYPRFPRYLFVHCSPPYWPPLTDWPLSQWVRGVLCDFATGRPLPLPPADMERLRAEDGHVVPPTVSLHKGLMVGQQVRIRYGPFASFEATLDAIDEQGAAMTVHIFGRPTPVRQPLGWLEAA